MSNINTIFLRLMPIDMEKFHKFLGGFDRSFATYGKNDTTSY